MIYHKCHPTGISAFPGKDQEERYPSVGLEVEFRDPINEISQEEIKRKYHSKKHRNENQAVTPINHLILKGELYTLVEKYDKHNNNLKGLKKAKKEMFEEYKTDASGKYSSIVNSKSNTDQKDISNPELNKPELNKPINSNTLPVPQGESVSRESAEIQPISKMPSKLSLKTDSPSRLSEIKGKTRTLSKNNTRNSKAINFQELKEVQEEYNDIKQEMDNKLRLLEIM